jgi:uncharacterized protein (DUF305 family)
MWASTLVTVRVAVVGGALLLIGCGDAHAASTPTGSASAQAFASMPTGSASARVANDADVAFDQQMIVHHQQGIMVADLAKERAESARVKQLATQIAAEQPLEIATMSGWLRAWGKPVPGAASPTPTGGGTRRPMPTMMPPSMTPMMPSVSPPPGMSGMMGMHGAAFDQMFLKMMIAHDEDGVAMAKTEQATGANPQEKQLARNIETSQTAQIAQMQQMLQSPPAHHS